jgi:hypothetical protein
MTGPTLTLLTVGSSLFFGFQFCEVDGLVIIHNRTLAKFGYRSERKNRFF